MSRKVILNTVLFLGVAMLSLVGLKQAVSSSANGVAADPSSAGITADKAGGLLEAQSDKDLIAKQKTCPVSGKLLGGMGTPVKVTVKDRTVFLCCAGCKAKFLQNVDFYLAKLDKQNQKDQQNQK